MLFNWFWVVTLSYFWDYSTLKVQLWHCMEVLINRNDSRAHTSMRDRWNPAFFHKFPPKILNPVRDWRTGLRILGGNFLYNNYPQLCATNSEDKHSELRRKIADYT